MGIHGQYRGKRKKKKEEKRRKKKRRERERRKNPEGVYRNFEKTEKVTQ
jgi:hypothetical protein